MTTYLIAVISLILFILLGETILWRLFRRRIDPVTFPHERDRSQVGFFRIGRMRLFTMFHALALCVWTVFSLSWLW